MLMSLETDYSNLIHYKYTTGVQILDLIEFRREAREHSKEGELKC